jgi:hypothetical protein
MFVYNEKEFEYRYKANSFWWFDEINKFLCPCDSGFMIF